MTGNFEEMISQIDPDDAIELRAFQDFLRVVKINKSLRNKIAELQAKPATVRLISVWKAKRAEHHRVGLHDEVIRVLAHVADEVLSEWPDVEPATGARTL